VQIFRAVVQVGIFWFAGVLVQKWAFRAASQHPTIFWGCQREICTAIYPGIFEKHSCIRLHATCKFLAQLEDIENWLVAGLGANWWAARAASQHPTSSWGCQRDKFTPIYPGILEQHSCMRLHATCKFLWQLEDTENWLVAGLGANRWAFRAASQHPTIFLGCQREKFITIYPGILEKHSCMRLHATCKFLAQLEDTRNWLVAGLDVKRAEIAAQQLISDCKVQNSFQQSAHGMLRGNPL